jgi:hypothetical protein
MRNVQPRTGTLDPAVHAALFDAWSKVDRVLLDTRFHEVALILRMHDHTEAMRDGRPLVTWDADSEAE